MIPGSHVSVAEWRHSDEQLPFSFKNQCVAVGLRHGGCGRYAGADPPASASWVYDGVIYTFGGYDGRGNNNEVRMVDLRT